MGKILQKIKTSKSMYKEKITENKIETNQQLKYKKY